MLTRGTRPRALATSGGRALAGVLAVAVLATGCGSSDDDAAGSASPGGEASGSASDSATESTSPSPTPVPGLPTTYPPADGPRIKVPGASMHALPSYHRVTDYGILQGWGDGQSSVTFLPDVNEERSLAAFERDWVRQSGGGPQVQVKAEDGVAGGKYRAWHRIDSSSDPTVIDHTFGILFLDSAWLIKVRIDLEGYPEPLTEEEQEEVIGRLLASFKTDLD